MTSHDPIVRVAQVRIIKLSAELEAQLISKGSGGPALEILRRLRVRAAESLAGLPFCNLDDPADLIKAKALQNEVKRYDEWLCWLKEIVAEGKIYDQEISAQEREELVDLLTQTPEGEREAIALGLIDPPGSE